MAKLAIDRASIVFGKKSGDFHSKSGDREIFIILSKIGRSPEKSGDLKDCTQIILVKRNVSAEPERQCFGLVSTKTLRRW